MSYIEEEVDILGQLDRKVSLVAARPGSVWL
jgi:hypothetical protein